MQFKAELDSVYETVEPFIARNAIDARDFHAPSSPACSQLETARADRARLL